MSAHLSSSSSTLVSTPAKLDHGHHGSSDAVWQPVRAAAKHVHDFFGPAPAVAVVLGSGLGAFASQLSNRKTQRYLDIPHAKSSGVVGHAGELHVGDSHEGRWTTRVAVLSGRVHGYEGHTMEEVVLLVRMLAAWGVKKVVLTNAAGGVNLNFGAGDLMLITDHLNLSGRNPLMGSNDEKFGPRFVDMTRAYDPELADCVRDSAREKKLTLREGVYAQLSGPNYETPAEIRMLRALGADAVGMSTVPETLALRHMGVRVAGLSCITNMGAGITGETLSHNEVKDVADRSAKTFIGLLTACLPKIVAA